MPVLGLMEPQVKMAITAAPVELGERGMKISSSQAGQVAVEVVAQGQEGQAEMAAMGAGQICVLSLMSLADSEVQVVPVEAVQADEEGICIGLAHLAAVGTDQMGRMG
jgi:acetylornithine deacetylase/succinyl-diaminopimelate desuccinylase-like protein